MADLMNDSNTVST